MPSSKNKNNKKVIQKKEKNEVIEKADQDDEIPENVRILKEKWEKENPGKTYSYRKARNEMPTISDMLVHGAPESPETTTKEYIAYFVGFTLLFAASFAIFLYMDPIKNSKYPKGRFSLDGMKGRVNPNMVKPQPDGGTGTDPVRILEKKDKVEDDRNTPDHGDEF
jgi:hypothetical protein